MMGNDGRKGQIVTFYSYKGGTGRSMALANVAWILASNGQRVLAVDWDLEAPGLHRYFLPFLVDRELAASPGVIDFVLDYTLAAMTPPEKEGEPEKDWHLPYTNILRYALSLDWQFPLGGRLDFIPAGRQSESYSARVNSFNWQDFYTRLGGRAFLDAVKDRMRAEYDFVLIDSRTGVSDSSGICTVQMPDVLVVCHTLNNQSIRGAASVAATVRDQRQASPIRILTVPMRIENAEKDKRDVRREEAVAAFSSFGIPTFSRMQFPYIPYYAYEEILSTFGDAPEDTGTFLESAERLTDLITEGRFKHLLVSGERSRRKEVLAAYSAGKALPEIKGLPEPSWIETFLRGAWRDLRSTFRRPIVAYGLGLALAIALPWSTSSEFTKVRQQNEVLRVQLAAAEERLEGWRGELRPLRFEVISAECFWGLGETQVIDRQGRSIDFLEYLKTSGLRDRLMDHDSIIAVGRSSCEGGVHQEDERARRRADQLRDWLDSSLRPFDRPDLYRLSLGRFAGDCSPANSLELRRIILVGIDTERKALRESLRRDLASSAGGLDIDDYTSFDLDAGALRGR